MLNDKFSCVVVDENIGKTKIEKLRDTDKRAPLKIMPQGRTEIGFGYGKVLITPIMRKDKTKGAIVLQPNKGTGTVAEEVSTDTFSESGNDILLTFANTESIDVLIRRLEQLNRMMNGQEDGMKESDYDL